MEEGIEVVRAVAEAAAVGRVPMALWWKARIEHSQRRRPSMEVIDGVLNNLCVRQVSRTHISLRDEQLSGLYHYLWCIDQIHPNVPTDLKLHMFNFVHTHEAHQRARRAISVLYGWAQPPTIDYDIMRMPWLQAHGRELVQCTWAMVLDSPFLMGTASMCDVAAPICFERVPECWLQCLVSFYADDEHNEKYFVRDACWLLMELTSNLELRSAYKAVRRALFARSAQ
jgi:hypothetical protein